MTGQASDDVEKIPFVTPRWCLVANVSEEYEIAERPGRPHFTVGAKVYVVGSAFNGYSETVTVMARHKGGSRWITLVMRSHFLENWRPVLEYSPTVIRHLIERTREATVGVGGEGEAGKENCADWARNLNQYRLNWIMAKAKREAGQE